MVSSSSEDALILLSGGQDSTTCLFWTKKKFINIIAISFDICQKNITELMYAKELCEKEKIEHIILSLPLLNSYRDSNNYISGRNMFFLLYAALFAKQRNIKNIVIGISQQDFSSYPDCTEDFIKSVNLSLNLSMDYKFNIHTPLMRLTKREIWHLADEFGVLEIVKNNTLTCYNNVGGMGCGYCLACKLRNRGYNGFMLEKYGEKGEKESDSVVSISWQEIVNFIVDSSKTISENGKPDIIVAIQRGGLIPGVILSHTLGVRNFIALDVRITTNDMIYSSKNEPILQHNPLIQEIEGKNILVVDDIVGSGSTYKIVGDYLEKYNPASIKSLICVLNRTNWEKNNTVSPDKVIDYIGIQVREWVEFPWERNHIYE